MNLRAVQRNTPFLATVAVCLLLYLIASVRYTGFASLGVFINFFGDNSFLGIAAIGMTFVILSGGIDLSVGGMVGLISVIFALLIEKANLHPAISIPLILLIGASFGATMGAVIQFFALPPFLVTLAGMFFARGLAHLQSRARRIRRPTPSRQMARVGFRIARPRSRRISRHEHRPVASHRRRTDA